MYTVKVAHCNKTATGRRFITGVLFFSLTYYASKTYSGALFACGGIKKAPQMRCFVIRNILFFPRIFADERLITLVSD